MAATIIQTFKTSGAAYDPSTPPPPFGYDLKKYWTFEEGFINLDHGAYGAQPLPVMAEAVKYQLIAEANPDKFHRVECFPLLTESRQLLANLIGAKLNEVVFIPNVTHGINTVLRNFEWKAGDIVLSSSTSYYSVKKTIQYLIDRSPGAGLTAYDLPLALPMGSVDIVDAFRKRIRELKQQHSHTTFSDKPWGNSSMPRANKFVVMIDSIISTPGVLLPWKELVAMCKEEGVWSVVDAAHSLGQEVNINLSDVQPDFWISNAHKWLYVKRGTAILYVPERNQHIIKSAIPTAHMYREKGAFERRNITLPTFVAQHEDLGTRDLSSWLTVKPALAFRTWLGGETIINAYCRDLALAGGALLADILGTELLDPSGNSTLNMTNVRLPLPTSTAFPYSHTLLGTMEEYIRDKLLYEWNTYAVHYFYAGKWWVRASAQVFNELSDFEYLGKALVQICKDTEEEFLVPRNSQHSEQARL
ncbi:hypothetical protein EIP91_002941 [Steccherinum ochraceum]|uniref:Aminotransferase class V domain-containing protein n=1 Tax=Steccherinum ochraceum TaxID=92696 RepID=A0A4R0RES7_9APHY|nr:hypothetical protein EIP91_002941 [Steccherinum ochraceum]